MILIPNSAVTPMSANKVINSMTEWSMPTRYCFVDAHGRYVKYDDNIDGTIYTHPGYYKAMWLAQNGDIRIGEDGEQLYRRVTTIDGPTENWKPFNNVSIEFDIPKGKQERGWTNAVRYVAQQNGLVVRRGLRIGDRAWWTRTNGVDAHIEAHNVGEKYAFEMYIDPKDVEAEQVEQARQFMQWLTADQHSYENLQAMWATPFLESYKHLGYILYGEGGNGKGILLERGLMGQFKREAQVVKASALASNSKFEAGQEITRLAGAWWAIDPESTTINEPVFETLKSICTGSTLTGRAIGQNAITVNNRATLVVATNMPVTTPRTGAFDRRIAVIRMVDGRRPSDFGTLLEFIDTYGVTPFIIASCQFWENAVNNRDDWNDPWTDVSAGNELDLDDMEQYIVDKIMEDGKVLIADIRHEFHVTRISRETKDKLGLESIASNSKRYLVVGDRNRFNAYVNEADYADDQPDDFEDERPNTDYTPLEDMLASDPKPLSQPGEGYSIVPAGQKKDQPKVAINWKRNYENHVEGDPDKPHAIVPDEQHMVIDMDTPKTGGEHGWDTLNREAGPLPETYTVRTPHDGIHLYYRIPQQWQGLMKSASHQHGLNVDVKAEAKGYVIGAGTHTEDGDYTLIDDTAVAEATPRMMRWLADHGYTSGRPTRIIGRDTEPTRNGDPDMTPVPEGCRNDTLYRWAFGRYHNHPEERDRVRDELFQRGHDSGLNDNELETIWNSVRNNA